MFYFHEWLSRRCNGRFSVLWLAATHPRKLRPRDFLMVDVARACDDVTKVVLVREREDLPARQRPRFSLYLSSQLAYGIVVIHRRQVDIFLGELSSYFLTVDISEKKVQKAVKGRKRKDEEEPGRGKRAVPEGRTEPGALVLAHTVQDVASITLREEVVRAPEPDELVACKPWQVFGEDLGPIPPAFFEGGNLMEMIIAMEAREQGEQAVPAVMETMLASVHEPSTSDTTGVTLPTMGQDVSRPPEMQESAPLVQLPEESQQTTKASVGLPPKASVAVSPTPPRPPAEPMEVSEQPGPPAGLVELVTPEPTEATVQPEQPPAGDVPQPVPATEERQALQILPDSSELQLPEAAQPPRRRRRRHGPVLVDRELRVPVEAMQASIQHYQDTMRAQAANPSG
ncbi:meiotic recombination protein REC8 homolog [Bacillus rossius redtenbacheri]|uniref:meiotic recombination protein REC8 homolog n=1 Tax=Bacillus rossius redtenbacheri TaxID=93214 RepID=UPI002FDCE209